MTFLLASRPFIFISGSVFLIFAGASSITYPLTVVTIACVAIFMFAMVLLDQASLSVAH
jgi:hypothetical protein